MSFQAVAEALAHFEGFYRAGSRAQRNNNPGNLRTWGNLPRDSAGYAIFPTPEAGWAALRRQVELDASRGLTLRQFLYKYAPPSDNNPTEKYLTYVARQLGADPDSPLSAAAGGPRSGQASSRSPTLGPKETGSRS